MCAVYVRRCFVMLWVILIVVVDRLCVVLGLFMELSSFVEISILS